LGVNGSVVHGRGLESVTFGGQWWCSAWSWVRIFDFLGVNGGVVHGPGFESDFVGVNVGEVHVVGSNLCLSGVINGGAVHVHVVGSNLCLSGVINGGAVHFLYGSPISRWFISSMDPFMELFVCFETLIYCGNSVIMRSITQVPL
jgi:hypothetical protein